MPAVSINYLAVISCGIIALIIGAIWYGPLFGKQWAKEHGFNEEDLKKNSNPAKTYGIAAIAHVVAAYVLAYLMGYLNAYSVSGALHTAFWSWLGFVFLPFFINSLFTRYSFKLVAIETGYFLLFFIAAALIIGLWV